MFLFSKNIKPNYDYLNLKLNINNPVILKDLLIEKCETLNMVEMAKDVKPFLFNVKDEKKVLLFKQYIEQNYKNIF